MQLPYVALFFAEQVAERLLDHAGDMYSDLDEYSRQLSDGYFDDYSDEEQYEIDLSMEIYDRELRLVCDLEQSYTLLIRSTGF